ncbi:MAG TPA: rRNA (guanine-N2)-methyltransferase [Treponema sp.]|nr:rRNA (guanine-N2)-methyltransferase [Treponema sp.]
MQTYTALCAIGAEKILGNELKHLGYKLDGNAPGRVRFVGDEDALYLSNICLRTADRVYLELARYEALNFDDLFDGCYAVDWQTYLKKDMYVVVDKVRVHKSKLNSEHTIQSMVQKAIYKKLGDVWHISTFPETGDRADIRVYLENDTVYLLLDTSGEALHKRGYRADGGTAPLRETMAAILLQQMMWRRKLPLYDPFCGSGTIVIEAALYAHDIAPGLARGFAFEGFANFNPKRFHELRRKQAECIRTDVECHICGSDIDPSAVERSRQNAEYACAAAGKALQMIGSDAKILRPEFSVASFDQVKSSYETGLVLCNPPYGERLGDESSAKQLYGDMASLFTQFDGWKMGVITSQKCFEECIGKHASLTKAFKAGNLDTMFYMFS